MLPRLLIIGAGGHGRESFDVAVAHNRSEPSWNIVGFVDDGEPDIERLTRLGMPLLGPVEEANTPRVQSVLAIGQPTVRARVAGQLDQAVFATIIHPAAAFGNDVHLGVGAIVAANATITANVRTGAHVHLNPGAVISHDCRLGSFVSISPGAIVCGDVTIGDRVLVGAGAVILPGRTIADDAIIGAGAVVTRDVGTGVTVLGNPARPIG